MRVLSQAVPSGINLKMSLVRYRRLAIPDCVQNFCLGNDCAMMNDRVFNCIFAGPGNIGEAKTACG
jgi:hypothetical protein